MIKFILGLLIISNSVFASKVMTREEFLDEVDKDKVSFELDTPIRNEILSKIVSIINIKNLERIRDRKVFMEEVRKVPSDQVRKMEVMQIAEYKLMYPYFKNVFAYTRFYEENSHRYELFFDYKKTNKCMLRVNKIDPSCNQPICKTSRSFKDIKGVDFTGKPINKRYCEKIYKVSLEGI